MQVTIHTDQGCSKECLTGNVDDSDLPCVLGEVVPWAGVAARVSGDGRGTGVPALVLAGDPIPLNGVPCPEGGAGICMSCGLGGMIFAGRSGMWIRFARLLYDAGTICYCGQFGMIMSREELTSMISSRRNSRPGMSVALHAKR